MNLIESLRCFTIYYKRVTDRLSVKPCWLRLHIAPICHIAYYMSLGCSRLYGHSSYTRVLQFMQPIPDTETISAIIFTQMLHGYMHCHYFLQNLCFSLKNIIFLGFDLTASLCILFCDICRCIWWPNWFFVHYEVVHYRLILTCKLNDWFGLDSRINISGHHNSFILSYQQ